jgi:hypothetical protein
LFGGFLNKQHSRDRRECESFKMSEENPETTENKVTEEKDNNPEATLREVFNFLFYLF